MLPLFKPSQETNLPIIPAPEAESDIGDAATATPARVRECK